jgi:hypothetical protein
VSAGHGVAPGVAGPDQPDAGPGDAERPDAGPGDTGPDADPRTEPAGGEPPVRGRGRRLAAVVGTLVAAAWLQALLVFPHDLRVFSLLSFARIPIEGLVGAALLLVLPGRARRRVAVVAGVLLGLVALLTLFDIGFQTTLNRYFDLVLDWSLFSNATDYLDAVGGVPAVVGGAVGAGLLALGVVALTTWSVLRCTAALTRHRRVTERAVAGLAVLWTVVALVGVQVAPGNPLASRGTATLVADRAGLVDRSLHDLDDYRRELAVDRFRDVPAGQLLTGLRGKDVMLAFVESYGRTAVDDPAIGPEVRATLATGTSRLAAAGFQARSGWLTSSTAGGASWLAHSTLLSGTEVDNPQRYRTLLGSDRFTLDEAFGKAGWRTVTVLPAVPGGWPEGAFYDYDRIATEPDLGYHGPKFGWSTMPDQYTLEAIHRLELAKPDHPPVLLETALTSSHAPWAPLPRMVDWNTLGDGTVFAPQPAQGKLQSEVWPNPRTVKAEYGHSVEYSIDALVGYLQRYGTKNTVLVFLGDHQPLPLVTGVGASRDVPVTVVAKDPKVLDAIASWGWTDGLAPAHDAPVIGMWQFRDRFLAAFGAAPPAAP